jgi:hypothetical protein
MKPTLEGSRAELGKSLGSGEKFLGLARMGGSEGEAMREAKKVSVHG